MSKTSPRRLLFISRSDINTSPYAEIALPALAADGWDITVCAPHADKSLLQRVKSYACRSITLDFTDPLRSEINIMVSIPPGIYSTRIG